MDCKWKIGMRSALSKDNTLTLESVMEYSMNSIFFQGEFSKDINLFLRINVYPSFFLYLDHMEIAKGLSFCWLVECTRKYKIIMFLIFVKRTSSAEEQNVWYIYGMTWAERIRGRSKVFCVFAIFCHSKGFMTILHRHVTFAQRIA